MLPWLRFAAFLAVLACATPAVADWRLAEGIDIATGGASTLLIGDLDTNTSLYARCVAGKPELFVDMFDGQETSIEPVGEVTLSITTDSGRTWTSPARYLREKSGYITTTWLSGETISSVVADIAAAKSAVSVSIEFEEVGSSIWDTNAKGSTAAGRKFLEACPLSASAPRTAAAPAAPVRGGAWTVSIEPDPVNGGDQISLIGDLDQGGYFYAFCNGRRAAGLFFFSNNPQTFPYEPGDVGLTLAVEIDGETRSATGEVIERPNGDRAILYTGHEYLRGLLDAVGGARSEVAMTIHSYSNEITTRWPAKNLVGLADGMARFRAHCFGSDAGTTVAQPAAPATGAPSGNWEVLVGDAAAGYSARAMMKSPPAADLAFAALACLGGGDDWAFFILAPAAAEFPLAAYDDGFMLNLDIGGSMLALWGGQAYAQAGVRGVIFRETPAEVLSILGVLSIEPSSFAVELSHSMSGQSVRYDLTTANVADAAAATFAGCYS